MPITPRTLARHGLTGLPVEVAASTNPSFTGLRGTVAGETRHMLLVEASGKTKMVPKGCTTFVFTLPDGTRVKVDGAVLTGAKRSKRR